MRSWLPAGGTRPTARNDAVRVQARVSRRARCNTCVCSIAPQNGRADIRARVIAPAREAEAAGALRGDNAAAPARAAPPPPPSPERPPQQPTPQQQQPSQQQQTAQQQQQQQQALEPGSIWELLMHPDTETTIARAKSASDASLLRRKGHLKEQDRLIEYMRRMHETHTCNEVMLKMERWIAVRRRPWSERGWGVWTRAGGAPDCAGLRALRASGWFGARAARPRGHSPQRARARAPGGAHVVARVEMRGPAQVSCAGRDGPALARSGRPCSCSEARPGRRAR